MELTKQRDINEKEAELVAALRSGEYAQGRYELRKRDGYCCLGVACDISKLGKWKSESYDSGINFVYIVNPESYNAFQLPFEVKELLGWYNDIGGLICPIKNKHSLVALNDHGYSFDFIARVIELGYVRLAKDASTTES